MGLFCSTALEAHQRLKVPSTNQTRTHSACECRKPVLLGQLVCRARPTCDTLVCASIESRRW